MKYNQSKILFFFFLLLGGCELIFSQTDTLVKKDSCLSNILETKILRKGVYRNLQEFENNSPYYALNISTFKHDPSADYCVKTKGGKMTITDASGKKVKFEGSVWGFCDGEKVFFKYGHSSFGEILLIGPYCVFSITKQVSSMYYVGGTSYHSGYTGGYWSYGTPTTSYKEYILNILTGEKLNLTERNLMNYLLVNDAELMDQFKQEKLKKIMIYQYVKKYNDKHPVSF
jgi:hypothetical protein